VKIPAKGGPLHGRIISARRKTLIFDSLSPHIYRLRKKSDGFFYQWLGPSQKILETDLAL